MLGSCQNPQLFQLEYALLVEQTLTLLTLTKQVGIMARGLGSMFPAGKLSKLLVSLNFYKEKINYLLRLKDCIRNTTAVCNPRQNSVRDKFSLRQNSV